MKKTLLPACRALLLALFASALATTAATTVQIGGARTAGPPAPAFAALIDQLSEPGGDFDTDNLISNERSYLHVVPSLEREGLAGGVYIGVGPDQNFSYIARLRPTTAFIVDIRRDNLLLHLLFKSIFALSRNRAEFLARLTGRPAPARLETWRNASIGDIAAYVDKTGAIASTRPDAALRAVLTKSGVALSAGDLAAIDRFHESFIREGLSLRFHTSGRAPLAYYPTYRELLLETDRQGRQLSYLASEDDFQFVKRLQARDGVIPVVGDLGGPHALAAIGRLLLARGDRVSAFYVSNVEDYLFRNRAFARYIENVRALPRSDTAIVVRSIFRYSLPETAPGYASTSIVQNMNDLVTRCGSGLCRGYPDLFPK